jgi:hypothetical protein
MRHHHLDRLPIEKDPGNIWIGLAREGRRLSEGRGQEEGREGERER